MHFVSFNFLGFFLAVLLIYWSLRAHRHRMLWLLLASCVFYMSWNPLLILLILFSASVDYFAALAMERTDSPRTKKWLLIGSISINLGLLAYFKYALFFLGNLTGVINLVGIDFHAPIFEKLALPLGISFYTFETISYVVDVYRGRAKAVRNLLDYSLYIMFFPHLMAGPIVRPHDFLPQLNRTKRFSWNRGYLGLQFVILGLFKKAAIADNLATIIDPVFRSPGDYNSISLWLAVLGYAMQIYGDFSGYSDIAIGLAHMLGFKLPNNFNMPYFAANIAEFWHRWHISLSTWLRDYLYIPLGGSRGGAFATYRNLLLTMLLGGFWHGANWTFVVWGLWHGVWLCLHRALAPSSWLAYWPRVLGIPLTFLTVCVGWVFFRAESLGQAGLILQGMALPTAGASIEPAAMLMVICFFVILLIGHLIGTWGVWPRWERSLPEPVLGVLFSLALLLALLLHPINNSGFIYFQF